jgi:LysM repeat protein
MTPNNFEQEAGEHSLSSAHGHPEGSPGVYVRGDESELPQELDVLWSGSKAHHREERSPIVPFLFGLIVGAALAAAFFFLFMMRPDNAKIQDNSLTLPVTDSLQQDMPTLNGENGHGSSKHASTAESSASNVSLKRYTVKSGDTLSTIAEEVYGSSQEEYVEKIQRANKLDNPNQLKLDQELIIPPKRY